MMRALILIISLSLVSIAPSAAQEPTLSDVTTIPPEYVMEAETFKTRCERQSVRARYNDCECLAAAFLKSRIEQGPFATYQDVELGISQRCLDLPKIAGRRYQRCERENVTRANITDLDDYCSCVANEYARGFERTNRRVSSKVIVALDTRALQACRPQRTR